MWHKHGPVGATCVVGDDHKAAISGSIQLQLRTQYNVAVMQCNKINANAWLVAIGYHHKQTITQRSVIIAGEHRNMVSSTLWYSSTVAIHQMDIYHTNKGRSQNKITGLFGNFSQMADPPPLLGTPYSKKNYRLFCILGP